MSLRKYAFALAALAVAAAGCGKDDPGVRQNLTQHEKDSILGASQIPGARAVKTSLKSADSAAARQARMDSADREP